MMKKYNLISVSRNSRTSEAGFTLLEILIAITLLAFISLGVVNITDNASLTMERTTEINEQNLQIETALGRFEWDFSQIYSPLYFSRVMNLNPQSTPARQGENPGGGENMTNPYLAQYMEQLSRRFERNEHFSAVNENGIPIPRFYAPDKSVFEFFTSSNRRKVVNQKQSHFAWVRYALGPGTIEDEEENPNIPKGLKSFVRYFTPDDPYSPERLNTDQVKGAVLLKNVEKLEFQYWDFARRKWQDSLRSIQGGENLIRGVKILISWYDSFGNKRSTSRVFRTHWPMVVPQDQIAPSPGGGDLNPSPPAE